MRKTTLLLLMSALVLGGCATVRESRLNPANWFERSQPVVADTAAVSASGEEVNPLIPDRRRGLFAGRRAALEALAFTTPIERVTDVQVDRVPGGAILRVTGLDRQQGAFNVLIVPEREDELPENGVLAYTLERQLPSEPRPAGPEATRQVVAARHLTDQQLAGVRSIRVSAAGNAREVRR